MNRLGTLRGLPVAVLAGVLAMPGIVSSIATANTLVPPAEQEGTLVVRGATIHTVSGAAIEGGELVVSGGVISEIRGGRSGATGGTASQAPASGSTATTLDLDGLHVYPGLISANTVLGLVEIQAVRATVDVQEPGPINPNARAEIAVNPDSENLPVTRANGILAALTAPLTGGSLLAGTSAVIQLDGWTWEDMTVRAPVGMHVALPALRVPDGLEDPQRRDFVERRDDQLELLETSFDEARAYRNAKAAGTLDGIDRRWEAMIPVFDGALPIFAHVDELSQIRYVLNLAEEHGFRLVIVGGADAWRVADLLAARDIPVIVGATHVPPMRRWEGYSTPSENPIRLHEAGVRVAIANMGGTFLAPHERNLPYEAAEAVAYGLDPVEALRMITLYPAEILGVADRLGSIDVGKDATFIVTDGNPLDIRTNVLRAFVRGREIDLSSRHTELNEKYSERLRQLGTE